MLQDSFVEGGEQVELSWGEQIDEVPADVRDVPGCRLLDGGAAGRQQADQGAAGVGGVGLAADQPVLLHAPQLVGEAALLPAQCVAQLMGRHLVPVVIREQRQDLVVGPGQARFLQARSSVWLVDVTDIDHDCIHNAVVVAVNRSGEIEGGEIRQGWWVLVSSSVPTFRRYADLDVISSWFDIASMTCSNGLAETSTSTDVLAFTLARSSASVIAFNVTCSGVLSSVAILSSSRAIRSAASAMRCCALRLACGARPPCVPHTC